ncbi:L-glutamate-binding protein /L-aspartate-binding protein [Pseudomonas delhiensis]|uniref:L-glutamate-binding protein /L-aspartate-binding protein n=1 Tax=Pseudomonas delhiensis TaxID=366289 RepID=A0A239EA91_9PSED|nr:transporter substrate-binding domain-containing protein [Pseudomonas delhiensis]SDI32340.1 L-glutamate-binding protein /L-aspartate-binding protein [Pseudomonas delhiensis]SNS41615.1 L-glutamate-binding protein /L-aspartate-binding protein [Pseudomonas delhiensis]
MNRLALGVLAATSLFCCVAQANEELQGTLKKVADRGEITLGYRDASVPFSYLGDNTTQPMGYSVDLANKVVEHLKTKLGRPELKVKHNLVTSQTRIPLVQNGTVDLECGSTAVTGERMKQVAFSYGFIYVKGQLLTAKNSGIDDLDDLKGKNVVTTAGTTNERFLKVYNANHSLGMNVISAKDHGEAFLMLQSGRAVAFFMDDALLYGERAKARDPHAWVVVGEPYSREIYACMVRRNDPQFLNLVNHVLADLYASGEIRSIYRRWFEEPIPPKGLNLEFPMSNELQAIIEKPSSQPVQ